MEFSTLSLKVARGENLPLLPEVVSSIFKIADDPKSTPKDIEILASRDPALTAKLLRVANSPVYGVSEIPTIARALPVLGMSKVRNLLISVAFQNLANSRGTARKFRQVDYWRHSLAVAISARMIAQYALPLYAERMFCVGMLHDIGLIAMDKFCPEVLDANIEYAENNQISLHEAESRTRDFTHVKIGSLLAEKWGFGPEAGAVIADHHDVTVLDTKAKLPATVIYVADILAHETGFTNQLPQLSYGLEPAHAESLGMNLDQFDEIRQGMCDEVMKIQASMMIMAAA